MSYVRQFPAESFDELLAMLESALLPQMLYMLNSNAERNLWLQDPELDDDAYLDICFNLDVQFKDVEGVLHHWNKIGKLLIDFTKRRIHFVANDGEPIPYNDNYYVTAHICQVAEEIANRVFDRV